MMVSIQASVSGSNVVNFCKFMLALVVSHPVLKAKPNAMITCAPGSSYTHA
jgi:hypothetical protein